MPTYPGNLYRPISTTQAAGMYNQARQILRGQMGGQTQGGAGRNDQHIIDRMTARYLQGTTVQPADRGRMLQIINQAQRSIDTGHDITHDPSRALPASALNIDPTIEATGLRFRYRVVARIETMDGDHSETMLIIDSNTAMSERELQARGVEMARQYTQAADREYQVTNWGDPTSAIEIIVVSAGVRR